MRRALSVGIDHYPFGSLSGCVNDASRMARLLATHHDSSPNFECKLLTASAGQDGVITRSTLREHLQRLFKEPADVALLHFSGHGTVNNLDGYLVTQDAAAYDEGVPMSEVIRLANESAAREVVIFLDCCYAGNLGNIPAIDNTKSLLRDGVSILTAARGDQPSVETSGGGLFTSLVVDALDGGAANVLGEVSAPAIYAFVEAALGAWDQRPLFKAHVSKVIAIRRCTPPIEKALLRRLPLLFPLPAEDHPLDPTYEKTSPTNVPQKVERLSELQALNRVHLVVPIGVEHMYDAAMQSRPCRLTPTGRYYWRLAKNNRI